jgi:hypothetical protein
MGSAFEFAKNLASQWMQDKPDNPAPVIINVSDGLPCPAIEEQKAISESHEIMALTCADGHPLIFNAHIGNGSPKFTCNESETELGGDKQAEFLFKISSTIPDSYKEAAMKQELDVRPASRGFVSNADPETFINFINFGSSGGSDRRQ